MSFRKKEIDRAIRRRLVIGLGAAFGAAAPVVAGAAGPARPAGPRSNPRRDFVSVMDFGARGDGVSDDTAAIQAAIDYFANTGGTIILPGAHLISDTLNYTGNGLVIQGSGWGRSTQSPPSGYLKWAGPAGVPMLRIASSFGGAVRDLRFIGNSSRKPLCAIQYDATKGNCLYNRTENIWIGQFYGFDADPNHQFQNGIHFKGTINGDSNSFNNIRVTGCDNAGVWMENPNAGGCTFYGLFIYFCKYGIRASGLVVAYSVFMGLNENELDKPPSSQSDIKLEGPSGSVFIKYFVSEYGTRLCERGASTAVNIEYGSFELTKNLHADGYIVYGDDHDMTSTSLSLKDMMFDYTPDFANRAGAPPKVKCFPNGVASAAVSASLVNVGLFPSNLDLGSPVWRNDCSRNLIYIPAVKTSQDPMPMVVSSIPNWDYPTENRFQPWRNDFPGKVNSYGGPLNVWPLKSPSSSDGTAGVSASGAGATRYSYRITALTHDGETEAGAAVTCTSAASLGQRDYNTVTWLPVLGAYAYNIYGRTPGSEGLLATVTWEDLHPGDGNLPGTRWVDRGTAKPGRPPPARNTTGLLRAAGAVFSSLPQAGNDAAAAALLVPVGGLYANGSQVMVRRA